MTEHSTNPFTEDSEEEKEDKKNQPNVSFFELFRFATKRDVVFMSLASITSAIEGSLPVLVYIDILDLIMKLANTKEAIDRNCEVNDTAADEILLDDARSSCNYCFIMCAIAFCGGISSVILWKITSENQILSIRKKFLWSILRHDIEWFNEYTPGKLNNYRAEVMELINRALGSNISLFANTFSGGIVSIVVAFAYQWKISLIILAGTPLICLVSLCLIKVAKIVGHQEIHAYEEASSVAEEVLSSVKTVIAFSGESKECKRYDALLDVSKKAGIKKSFASGLATGTFWLITYSFYAFGMWFCDVIIRNDDAKISHVLTSYFCLLNGSLLLGASLPAFEAILAAKIAAYKLYKVIDEEPSIDNLSTTGVQPNNITGDIEFQNVSFRYPSRPDIQILSDASFIAKPGVTVALVGASGSGKSTVLQLLQRLHDAPSGMILAGGRNIQEYNIGYFRKLFGVVSQEPVLFGTTIGENIRNGNEDATKEDIIAAAAEANAHDFISELPEKYDTLVGERGSQLSGGQKQRIAIARALVRKPLFLLLDEATSALDTESENIVQSALDKIRKSRTTIVVAHRLSTIRSADMILCFNEGKIIERGTHEELMKKEGLYHSLVLAQRLKDEETEKNKTETSQVRLETSRRQSEDQTSENGASEEEDKDVPKGYTSALLKLNKPEWREIVIGVIASICLGIILPFYGVLIPEAIENFGRDRDGVRKACLFFLLIGALSFILFIIQYSMLGISGENLSRRIRSGLFKSILHQEMAWFDKKQNTSGYLCSVLATDASRIKEASGIKVGFMLQSITLLIAGLSISFAYGPLMTLFMLAFIPVLIYTETQQQKLFRNSNVETSVSVEASINVMTEALQNIKTVLTVSLEKKIYQENVKLLESNIKISRRPLYKAAITNGISQGLRYIFYASLMFFGCLSISKCYINFKDFLTVGFTISIVTIIFGQQMSVLKNMASVSQSTSRIMSLINKLPSQDVREESGVKPDSFKKNIQFKEVEFHYPNRQNIKVLQGLNLDINCGETVALVGRSGCGKSTCMQLIEKFYYPDEGTVYLDGKSLNDINTSWLRQQIALVSQEPVLFSRSIEENIAYGDLSRSVTIDEIVNAAQQANVHSFINSLPEGYATKAGTKGSQLSGGQKQRIAIARALVRNPKILLLDEATSALDTESEKIVQAALDKAKVGRTCLIVAHRLSTIRNSDRIAVIDEGKVQEIGSHTELEEKKGIYFELLNSQNL